MSFCQVTTGHTRDKLVENFKKGRQQFTDAFAGHALQKRAFERDKKNVFFEWFGKCEKTSPLQEEVIS
jgi:hypothetical protein